MPSADGVGPKMNACPQNAVIPNPCPPPILPLPHQQSPPPSPPIKSALPSRAPSHLQHLITPILIRRNQKPPRRLAPMPRNRIPIRHQDKILRKPPLLLVPRIRAQHQRPRHRHQHHDPHALRGLSATTARRCKQLRRRREAVVGVEDVGVERDDVVAHGGGGGGGAPCRGGWGWGGGGGGALLGEDGVVLFRGGD